MIKYNTRYGWLLAALMLLMMGSGCSRDTMKDINTNPGDITEPDVRYLFTEALRYMKPLDYRQYFYDYSYMLKWGQITASSSGNGDRMNEQGIADGLGGTVYRVMSATKEIQHLVNEAYAPEEAAKYKYIEAMTYPIQVYLALLDTDMYGDMAYSEVFQARYSNPPILTPKYDKQQELLILLYNELKKSVETLTNPVTVDGKVIDQTSLGRQDLVYSGSPEAWARFANSLKLKIAVRLLHADKAMAFKIAEEAYSNPAGLMEALDHDFIWNLGIKDYHFNDPINPGALTKQLRDFMVDNRDPRIRFFFTKNSFNSKVVQAFFDHEAENPETDAKIPDYIMELVDYTVDADNHKVFKGWKAPGEPWVRYFGVPTEVFANEKPEYKDYFDPQGLLWKITLNDQERPYNPISGYNTEMVWGRGVMTFPDAPGAAVVQDKEPQPWYGVYMSSAEVQLYLAELKTLGANIGIDAKEAFAKGVELSVRIYDKVAALNKIPYYEEAYDKQHGKPIKLVNGEIEYMLGQPAYQLTGDKAKDLEKIYLQQHIHFTMLPAEMYVSMRRSGVPMYDSNLLPFVPFDGKDYPLARRFNVNEPLKSDKMYQIVLDAYKSQGYTMSTTDVKVLNKERVWYDKGAPDFGHGPNL
ncbi:MAG: SusD/RagB family nutrient-binding outer membrane lipoprotein [Porphyromonas sp.]|nr:SusD/RagB family nutrient-binding outer membrane lipoprotein [Porphyromonas sp.]